MPEKLLTISEGVPKSLINQVTATESNVVSGKAFIGSDGTLRYGNIPDRGLSQYGSRLGSSEENGVRYFSIAKIPEGYYHSDGVDWAPEVRYNWNDVVDYLFNSHWIMVGDYVNGDNMTQTRQQNVTAGQVYLIIVMTSGAKPGDGVSDIITLPSNSTYVDVVLRPTANPDANYATSRVVICRFNESGTVTATAKTGDYWAACYIGIWRLVG